MKGGIPVSKKRRAMEKQKRENSPARKQKRAKKAQYASLESKIKWEEKKAAKAAKKQDP